VEIVFLKEAAQALAQLLHAGKFMEVNVLVFDRSPEPFDEDVVEGAAPSVQADARARSLLCSDRLSRFAPKWAHAAKTSNWLAGLGGSGIFGAREPQTGRGTIYPPSLHSREGLISAIPRERILK
jgi:hypothetical protein